MTIRIIASTISTTIYRRDRYQLRTENIEIIPKKQGQEDYNKEHNVPNIRYVFISDLEVTSDQDRFSMYQNNLLYSTNVHRVGKMKTQCKKIIIVSIKHMKYDTTYYLYFITIIYGGITTKHISLKGIFLCFVLPKHTDHARFIGFCFFSLLRRGKKKRIGVNDEDTISSTNPYELFSYVSVTTMMNKSSNHFSNVNTLSGAVVSYITANKCNGTTNR
ncbi:hypothetical protein K501DRAFT_272453 [Backusella circina FSU 941]|nr:hypothetical protein K501DRAFT_272453 [Backusella circina FSU 941]